MSIDLAIRSPFFERIEAIEAIDKIPVIHSTKSDSLNGSEILNTLRKIVKYILQIVTGIFAAFDQLFLGSIQDRSLTDGMKVATGAIGFCGLFKKAKFWANPFSKETLDDKELFESIKTTAINSVRSKDEIDSLAKEIFDNVMRTEDFTSKSEVQEILRNEFIGKRIATIDDVDHLINGVSIKQKARSITLLFSKFCETIADVLDSLLTLGSWGIVNLSKFAGQYGNTIPVFGIIFKFSVETVIGTLTAAASIVVFAEKTYQMTVEIIKSCRSDQPLPRAEIFKAIQKLSTLAIKIVEQSPILTIVMKFSVKTWVGILACACLLFTLFEATYRAIAQLIKIYQTTELDHKEIAYESLRTALLDMLSIGADLLDSAVPLVFTVSPPVMIAFGLFSKSTGLIRACAKLTS